MIFVTNVFSFHVSFNTSYTFVLHVGLLSLCTVCVFSVCQLTYWQIKFIINTLYSSLYGVNVIWFEFRYIIMIFYLKLLCHLTALCCADYHVNYCNLKRFGSSPSGPVSMSFSLNSDGSLLLSI